MHLTPSPRLRSLLAVLVAGALSAPASAAVTDRASVAGYFRLMARPDLQGGNGRLGYWNLYGRLLNEGPWAALELKLDLLEPEPGSHRVWTSAHFKMEGGSIWGADGGLGTLDAYRITQLYVRAGNVLLDNVTWQLGTLDTWMGDLGLYDMRPAELFYETLGLSATWKGDRVDLMAGLGDSGFFMRRGDYSPILTAGAMARWRIVPGLEIGGGAQYMLEPQVDGNPNAPHTTPDISYEDWVRGEVVQHYDETHTDGPDYFYRTLKPRASAADSWKAVAYLGFGGFGPIVWNSLYANVARHHPQNTSVETYQGQAYTLYVTGLTDEHYSTTIGNEMQIRVWPERLDAVWGLLYVRDWNPDNTVKAGTDNLEAYSTVLRLQLYLTRTIHFLAETSLAREHSLNGNLFRLGHDSIFASTDGHADSRGLQIGDTDTRDTWQLKVGPVFNPTGLGVYTRPSLRLLFGLQHSNVHAAFGNSLIDSLDDYNQLGFETTSRYWHAVVGLEAEAWF